MVSEVLKSLFARPGVPTTLVIDNGISQEMNQFATTYGFNHITSSPCYPQSNGLAERTVRTVKRQFSDSPDPFLALLSYRATPLPRSPAELLMGRVIKTDVPVSSTQNGLILQTSKQKRRDIGRIRSTTMINATEQNAYQNFLMIVMFG